MKMVFWLIVLVAVMGFKETDNTGINTSNNSNKYKYSKELETSIKEGLNTVTNIATGVATDVFNVIETKIEEYSN